MRITLKYLQQCASEVLGSSYGTAKGQYYLQARDSRVGGYELVQFLEKSGERRLEAFNTGREMHAFLVGLHRGVDNSIIVGVK